MGVQECPQDIKVLGLQVSYGLSKAFKTLNGSIKHCVVYEEQKNPWRMLGKAKKAQGGRGRVAS